MVKYIDGVIYWMIVLIPFTMAIAPAPVNVFMGFLIAAFLGKKILSKENIFTKTQINMPLLFLFSITCLSLINSVSLKDSVRGGVLRLLQYIFVVFSVAEGLKDKNHVKRIIFSVVCGICFTFVDEAWQLATGRDFVRGYEAIVNIGLLRATAAFKDSNILGVYLSAITPLILGLALFYAKGKGRVAAVIVGIFALLGILLTYSRPTLLAVYIALFFFGVARKNKALIIFLLIFTAVSPFLLPKSVKGWARQLDYNPLRIMCNDDRIAIYRNSLNMIKHNPVLGVGANTFMKNYQKYKEYPEYRGVVTSDYIYAHNNFLHMAAEIGLAGLAVFLWLLYALFKECRRIYKKLDDPYFKVISLSLSACLIAFLVNGLTESSLYSSRVALIFWYLIGLSLALKKFTHADNPATG